MIGPRSKVNHCNDGVIHYRKLGHSVHLFVRGLDDGSAFVGHRCRQGLFVEAAARDRVNLAPHAVLVCLITSRRGVKVSDNPLDRFVFANISAHLMLPFVVWLLVGVCFI